MGELRVMGRKGDTKLSWDTENPAEVEVARKAFEEFYQKGFAAFLVKTKGGKGMQIEKFDPEADRILFIPPIAGGSSAR